MLIKKYNLSKIKIYSIARYILIMYLRLGHKFHSPLRFGIVDSRQI
jgi:hypothetical protein